MQQSTPSRLVVSLSLVLSRGIAPEGGGSTWLGVGGGGCNPDRLIIIFRLTQKNICTIDPQITTK